MILFPVIVLFFLCVMPLQGKRVPNICHLVIFQLDWVFEAFDNSHCPLLQNKPKMFFIQACRGGKSVCLHLYFPFLCMRSSVCTLWIQDSTLFMLAKSEKDLVMS